MIQIIQKPQSYTLSDNPIIFQAESNQSTFVYFKIEVFEALSMDKISDAEVYGTPTYQTGSYIDLTRILTNAVRWQIDNDINTLSVALSKPIMAYKVTITEYGIVNDVISELSTAITLPDTFYVWNGGVDRFSFYNFSYTDYVITSGLPAKFLTNKPDNSTVNDFSSEQLYFIQSDESILNTIIKTYNAAGTLLNTYSSPIDGVNDNKMFRLQVSPKSLKETLFVDFNNVDFYTVHIEDENDKVKTETRKYFYKESQCNTDPQNIFWVNSLGGIDTFQFVNVTESNNISRTTIKKNPYKIVDGYYTERTGEVMNTDEEIVNITQQGTYTAYSQIISDETSKWLNELFSSKQVFIELSDGSLMGVIVKDTTYNVLKQKRNKQNLNSTQVTYTVNGGLIPSTASSYVESFNGAGQINFIEQQMMSLT